MIDPALLAQASANLEERARAVGEICFSPVATKTFSFGEIRAGIHYRHLTEWLGPGFRPRLAPPAIYRFMVDSEAGATSLRHAFERIIPEGGIKFTRNNGVSDSRTIYVGSSRNTVSRLKEHLNDAAGGTYALKMRRWCPQAPHILHVEVAASLGQATSSQIQDIEDALWIASRPIFGKMGGR